jgi:6-pyruvoyltetrahydropterin/6-carboxytetrahydropterin synthase
MVQIGSKYAWEAAHRQFGDESKCGFLHGHNWIAEVIIDGYTNGIGYVVDFKDIKDVVNELDHKTMLVEGDPLIEVLRTAGQRVIVLPKNPTCENVAEYLTKRILELSGTIKKVTVIVWENEKSFARFTKSNKRGGNSDDSEDS